MEEQEPEDPFAGLDLDSKEFLQRKVEVLEKELAEVNARVVELEGDAACTDILVQKNILKTGKTQELVDTYFRLAADFDNFRKRAEGNLVQAKDTATADIVKELLTILDNFERAASAIKTETDREKSINQSYQVSLTFLPPPVSPPSSPPPPSPLLHLIPPLARSLSPLTPPLPQPPPPVPLCLRLPFLVHDVMMMISTRIHVAGWLRLLRALWFVATAATAAAAAAQHSLSFLPRASTPETDAYNRCI